MDCVFYNFLFLTFGAWVLIKTDLKGENLPFHLLPWKRKPKNYLNKGSFLLHEATICAILVFLTKKTTNTQRKRTEKHETWKILLNEQRKLKTSNFPSWKDSIHSKTCNPCLSEQRNRKTTNLFSWLEIRKSQTTKTLLNEQKTTNYKELIRRAKTQLNFRNHKARHSLNLGLFRNW